jgi:hypothetical protein
VQRFMLQHHLMDDYAELALIAKAVMPAAAEL